MKWQVEYNKRKRYSQENCIDQKSFHVGQKDGGRWAQTRGKAKAKATSLACSIVQQHKRRYSKHAAGHLDWNIDMVLWKPHLA